MDVQSYEKLFSFIENSKEIIPMDGYLESCRFFEHGEFEMAFEGLLIELITEGKKPKGFNAAEWIALGKEFELDKDSVFDGDIWEKFIEWASK